MRKTIAKKAHFRISCLFASLTFLTAIAPAGFATTEQSVTSNSVNLQGMGFVTGLVAHPGEQGLVYIRTDVGGAYRWDTGNSRWRPLTDSFSADAPHLTKIESFAIDTNNTDLLYLAAGGPSTKRDGVQINNGTFLKSTDRGASWSIAAIPGIAMGGNDVWRFAGERLAVDPNNGQVLYFGSRLQGLWRSTDAGLNWSALTTPYAGTANIGVTFVLIDAGDGTVSTPTRSATLYYGVVGEGDSAGGVYRSIDGGESWTQLSGNAPTTWFRPNGGDISDDGTLYVAWSNSTGDDGSLRKIGRAESSWTDISPVGGSAYVHVDAAPGNVPHRLITYRRTFWKGGVYTSDDSGATWATQSFNYTVPAWWPSYQLQWDNTFGFSGAIAFDPFDSDAAWATDGFGAYRCDDLTATTDSWTAQMAGLEEFVINTILKIPGGDLLVGLWDMQGFQLNDPTQPPTANDRLIVGSGDEFGMISSIAVSANNPLTIAWVGSDEKSFPTGRQQISHDGGATWQSFGSLPSIGGMNAWNGDIAIDPDNPQNLVYAARFETGLYDFPWRTGVFYTTNGGDNWTRASFPDADGSGVIDDTTLSSLHQPKGHCLTVDDSGDFYLTDWSGATAWFPSVFKSSDSGANWSRVHGAWPPDLPSSGGTPTRLMAEPGKSGVLWFARVSDNGSNSHGEAKTKVGLWRSINGGTDFTEIDPTRVQRVLQFAFGKAAPGRSNPTLFIYGEVGGSLGLWRSDDATSLSGAATTAHWTRVDNAGELGLATISALAGDSDTHGLCYVGTGGRGVIVVGLTAFESWRSEQFSLGELENTAISGSGGNPDSDYLSNFEEFAFAADPKNFTSTRHYGIESSTHEGLPHLGFHYTRRTGTSSGSTANGYTVGGITYTVWHSTNLIEWETGADSIVEVSTTDHGDGTETVHIRAKQPLTSAHPDFFTLEVE